MTSLICLGTSITAWMVVIVAALLFPGGHPPLSGYLEFPVIVLTMLLSALGVVLSMKAKKSPDIAFKFIMSAMAGNFLILILGPAVLIWRLC